jgi:hypothetical protein
MYDRKESAFYIGRSSAGNIKFQFGPGTNDGAQPTPIPADFDGDGKTDPAVFDTRTATFYVAGWSGNTPGGRFVRQFGPANSIPVVADYDGDGKADIADYDAGSSTFFITRSTLGFPSGNLAFQFGPSGGVPIVADYDGDGRADPAVFETSAGKFYLAGWNPNNSVSGKSITQFGPAGSGGSDVVPLIGDFDGDGKSDIASFQRNGANFYITQSSLGTGGNRSYQFGQGTDFGGAPIPLPIPRYLLLTRKWV